MKKNYTRTELLLEVETLKAQLAEEKELLRAISSGEVDALVVSGNKGDQVFTLTGAEQPYRVIIEEMSEGAAMLDADDSILFCNSGFAGMLKTPLEKLIGTGIGHYVSPVDEAAFRKLLRQGRQRGSRSEIKLLAMDGTFVPVHLSLNTMQMGDAQYVYLVATDLTEQTKIQDELRRVRDELEIRVEERTTELAKINAALQVEIIQHKRAQEALGRAHEELEMRIKERTAELAKANEELYDEISERRHAETKIREQASLLDKAHDAIAVRDLEHRIIYWNNGAQCLYGWMAKEAIGKNGDELLYKGKNSNLIEAKKIVMEKGEWTGELEQITKEGKEIIVQSRWTLVRDSEDKPKSILIINTDITEMKNLQVQLLQAQKMESIGTLAGGIAHDLNNMLTPMMLSLQMLKEKFKDEKSQKLLTILEKNSERQANLIKQVLLFSRGVEGERTPLSVKQLICEIEKIAKETFPGNIEIRTDIPKDLFTISGDATQLHQVLINLCMNARDAMPDGGILGILAENYIIDEKHTRIHTEAKVGPYVTIAVSDTGIGIPDKLLDRIFEPFFSTKEFGKGTGLGLSIAHAIVKSHGGFINVYSEVRKGTTFKVYLPATLAEIQTGDRQQLELPIGHEELVLVVEDEDSIREVDVLALEEYGYNVLAANDGSDAVALYAQNKDMIKVVVIDMMMPVMDGHTTIKAIRKINPGVKIIAVSGLAEKDKLAKIADTRVHAFLPKPYTAEKLLKTIHEVLGKKDETSGQVLKNKSNITKS